MLFAEYGHTFGAARVLVQGVDFNCKGTICYGIGSANHALFLQLQQTLNSFAKLGITAYPRQLVVDGKLGDETLAAARAAAAVVGVQPPASKEALAANAEILNNRFNEFLRSLTAATTAPTTTPTPTTVPLPNGVKTPSPTAQPAPQPAPSAQPRPTAPSTAAPPTAAPPPAPSIEKTPLWVWITAGVAGVILIGGAGYALLREPSPPTLGRTREKRTTQTYDLFWAPEGRRIATVQAPDPRTAIRKAPLPYRRYPGEIYAEPRL
jgi:lysozyme family protein